MAVVTLGVPNQMLHFWDETEFSVSLRMCGLVRIGAMYPGVSFSRGRGV